MGVQWTKEQKEVIELRERNILVSAAAGSGKTAVLVERIIQMLTDKDHPTDVDKLLIVTFTEAAASEMKERIRNAIEKELESRPEDVHLQRQATLIHSSRITTIHSFCLSVIREHFHVIDIDPAFRIMEEGERLLLKQDVLTEVLEQCYESQDEDFLELVEKLGGTKSDKKLEEQILKLYEYSRSYPQPEKWLTQCVENYSFQDTERRTGDSKEEQGKIYENSIFFKKAESYVRKYLQDIKKILIEGLQICEEEDGPYMYSKTLEDSLEMIEFIIKAKDFNEMYERTVRLSFGRLSSKKDSSVDADKRQCVKKMMEQVRELVKSIKAYCFYEQPEEMIEAIQNSRKAIKTFTELVQRFADTFTEKKQSKNMIDFNDMEQYALRILTEEKEGELCPSSVAREYQGMFEEVMIDEYQDSNLIQEAILTSVSRQSLGQNNIFRVGDVKQSIYRFRLSRPELFMEKYETYTTEESDCQRIDLHKNFRSRSEVLDSANFIFKRIMKKELGGIEYDDQAALYPGAEFLPATNEDGSNEAETELILLDCSKEKKGESKSLFSSYKEGSAKEMEARVIAKRIKQLMASHQITDKNSRELRPVRYKDIVILTRSVQGWSDTIAAELMEEGIPAYADSRTGYFEAYEVRVLLDYLRLLDNQKQDIPLAAVLTSPFVGLDAQEMARIRLIKPEGTFYEAVELFISQEADDMLSEKLKHFYNEIKNYREQLPYLTIHELLWKILDETGYGVYMAAMPGGEQRKANIEMLVDKAVSFERTSYKGLFHFIRYIEQLEKYNVDYGEAGYINEQSDAVQIMSIHKSKGLEFPVVFVAGLGKKFNMSDSSGEVVMHPELGVGIDFVDLEKRTKVPTLIKKMIQREVMQESLGEELRILYVAMTRAKEKLILVGQRNEESLDKETVYSNEIPFYVLSGAKNYLDWIIAAIWGKNAPVKISCIDYKDAAVMDEVESASESLAEDILENWDTKKVYDSKLKEQIEKQFSYNYPYEADQHLKLKFTVSELKKRTYLQEESGEILIEDPEVVPLLPRFLEDADELTGASRGSAYHKFLELLDFKLDYNKEKLQKTVEMLCSEKKLSKDMAECIRIEDILKFTNSNAARRMHAAANMQKLYKEQPFVLGVDSREIHPMKTEETVLIQGIIDVFWEEDGELILLDYKTDRIYKESELLQKYHLQLDYYAKALEQLLGKKVKEKIIYSFSLGKEIICK